MSGRGTDFGRLGSKFGRVGHKFCRLGSRFLSDAPKFLRFGAKKMSETFGIVAHFVGNPIINGVQIGPNFCRMGQNFCGLVPKKLQGCAKKLQNGVRKMSETVQILVQIGPKNGRGPSKSVRNDIGCGRKCCQVGTQFDPRAFGWVVVCVVASFVALCFEIVNFDEFGCHFVFGLAPSRPWREIGATFLKILELHFYKCIATDFFLQKCKKFWHQCKKKIYKRF